MPTIHYETLTTETRAIWDACNFDGDWYLAGGTALALQIGHRISIDLDFFSDKQIPKNLLTKTEEHFNNSNIQILIKTTTELTILIDGVKVTFLHYPFNLLYSQEPLQPKSLASITDIASMKAYTLGRRQSLKDYVDLYYILQGGYTNLAQIIADAQAKYGEAFNDRLFCEQLVYTDDLEQEPIQWLSDPVSMDQMKEYFADKIALYISK